MANEINLSNVVLTPKQTDYWDAIFKRDSPNLADNSFDEFAYFGGFGSGKSLIVMLVIYTLCISHKGCHGLFVRATYGELTDSVVPQFNQLFKEIGYKYNKSERIAYFDNGTRLDFRAFDKDTKILSNMYNFVAIVQAEETAYELFLQIIGRTRLQHPTLTKNMFFLEGNPSNGWCKERYKDNSLTDKIFFIEAKSTDNPFLPPEYIDRMRANYPVAWQRRYIDGEWENFDEMVFNEFRETEHIIDPPTIPGSFSVVIGADYGYRNPTALLWCAIDYDDNIIVYDEFYEAGQDPEQIASAAKRHGNHITTIDPSTKSPDMHGKCVYDELLKRGVNLNTAHKDKNRNINVTNMLFKQNRLYISRQCTNLIHEIKNFKWKRLKLGEEKNQPEEVIKKDDHACDALMYAIAYIEDLSSSPPTPWPLDKTLAYQTQKHDSNIGIKELG